MREATPQEFSAVSAKAGQVRHVDGGKRSMTVVYSDRGREIAEKTILYTARGKVSRTMLRIDAACLPDNWSES